MANRLLVWPAGKRAGCEAYIAKANAWFQMIAPNENFCDLGKDVFGQWVTAYLGDPWSWSGHAVPEPVAGQPWMFNGSPVAGFDPDDTDDGPAMRADAVLVESVEWTEEEWD